MARNQLILDRYRPIGESRSGGFGTVRVAWDTRIQRKVAIKCIELDEGDAARAALPGADAVRRPPSDADDYAYLEQADTAAMPSFDEVDWDDVPPWEDPVEADAFPWDSSDVPPWEDLPAAPPPDFESPFRKRDEAEARRAATEKHGNRSAARSAYDDSAAGRREGGAALARRDPADDLQPVRSLSRIPGLDEARTAAMLTDPNIVTVYDFEVQGRTAYLIMEYIEGITLTELLRDYASYLTLDMVAAVFGSIAHALEVAHENQDQPFINAFEKRPEAIDF